MRTMTPLTCPECGTTRLVNHQTLWAAKRRPIPGRCRDCGVRSYREESRARAAAVIASGEKWCRGCQDHRPLHRFTNVAKHLDGLSSYCKDCDKAIGRQWYEANKDYAMERSKRWNEANPLARRSIVHNCYGRRKDASAETIDHAAILDEHGWTCHICGDPILGLDDLDFDHVIPFVRGGTHTAANVRPSHSICNARKGQSEMTKCG